MAAARTVSVRLQADVAGYRSDMDKASTSTKRVGDEVESTGKRSKSGLGIASTAAAGLAVAGVAALGSMVKVSMDFDKAMSGVGAAANATGGELESLRQAAIKAGADTAFSAREAADAETELAKAGVSVKDILGGGLQGALDLAAAGQLDVGKAAEIAASAMTQFNLKGSQVPHVADLLAAGAGKAQGSVEDIGMALNQSGLVAAQFGMSIEETVGTLAEFASAGLIGSDAGTSLKTMLLALANPAAQTRDLMKELGINAYDAGGKFVGAAGLAEQLRSTLGGLTQAQRDQALAQIFGNDAIRAAGILFKDGAKGNQAWTHGVNEAGFAAEQARKKLDNLSGDLEQLRGSIETALIKGGSAGTGILRDMTKAATGLVNGVSSLPGPVQTAAAAFVAVSTAGTGAVVAFGTLAPKIREARTSLEAMGKVGSVASSAIGMFGKVLGGAIPILGVAAIAVELYGRRKAESTRRVNDFVTAIQADNGALGENTLALASNALEQAGALKAARDLGLNLEDVTNAALGNTGAMDRINIVLKAVHSGYEDFVGTGQAIPQVLGDQEIAAQALQKALGGTNSEVTSAVEKQKRLAEAQGKTAGTSKDLPPALDSGTQAILDQGKAAADAASKIKAYNDALFATTNLNLDVATSAIDFRNKLADLTTTVHDNGTALVENNAKSAEYNQKARDNRAALLELITAAQKHSEAVGTQTGREEDTRRAFEASIPQIVLQAEKLHLNEQQVRALIASVVALPAAHATSVTTPGAVPASESVQHLHDRLSKLPASDRVLVNVDIKGNDVTFSAAGSTENSGSGGRVLRRAFGGEIPGRAPHDRADNAWAKVTPGEWVIQKPTVDKLERRQPGIMAAINAGQVDIGGDPGVMRLSVGRPIRDQGPRAFADGGLVRKAQQWSDAQIGEPYVWGGTSRAGRDCSGFTGGAYAILTGKNPDRRYFTTASIGAAQGFKPGRGTFTVGVTAGSGHMAFNLAGRAYEATPPRLRSGAAASQVTSFARQFYLPQVGGRFVGGDGSAGPAGMTSAQIKAAVALVRPSVIKDVFRQLDVKTFDTGGHLEPHSATLAINGTSYREPVGDPGAGTPYRTQWSPGARRSGPTVVIPKGAVNIDLAGANGITEAGVERIVDGALDRFADQLGAVVGAGRDA